MGIIVSIISLLVVVTSEYLILKRSKIDHLTGELITYGTSICGQTETKLPVPIFILFFLIATVITMICNNPAITNLIVIGKCLLPIALFLVGYGIKVADVKQSGKDGITFGLSLWSISTITALILSFTFIK